MTLSWHFIFSPCTTHNGSMEMNAAFGILRSRRSTLSSSLAEVCWPQLYRPAVRLVAINPYYSAANCHVRLIGNRGESLSFLRNEGLRFSSQPAHDSYDEPEELVEVVSKQDSPNLRVAPSPPSLVFKNDPWKKPVMASKITVVPAKETKSSTKLSNDGVTVASRLDGRPMTAWERIVHFPAAVKQVVQEAGRYWDIERAAHYTPRNAWHGRLPRRQFMQQQQLLSDLSVITPTIIVWALPVVGTLPMILAVAAPRQVLSRQFHNAYEQQMYRLQLQGQCAEYRAKIPQLFHELVANQKLSTEPGFRDDNQTMAAEKILSSIGSLSQLPRDYLVTLSLAVGIHQRLPRTMAHLTTYISPSVYLQFRLRILARRLAQDDRLLIEEGHHESQCQFLTDDEVQEAWYGQIATSFNFKLRTLTRFVCINSLARGLPIESLEMRRGLSRYLQLMHETRNKAAGRIPRTGELWGLFGWHLGFLESASLNN
jgi:LETM1-like protein